MELEPLLKECEELVRAGKIASVRSRLAAVNTAQIPRQLRVRLANLCRRTDMLNMGIKVLSPVARPDHGRWTTNATAQELAEYAVLLQKSGAVREALWILNQIDPVKAPETLLFRSFCHFNRWEYGDTVELLRKYAAMETRPYPKLVGLVNLASALVALQAWPEALDVIEDCFKRAAEIKARRLQANCLEMKAQVHFHAGRWDEAKADLQAAADLATGNTGLDQLLIRKWQAVFSSFESKNPGPLLAFRDHAIGFRNWESVRETDRFLLKIEFSMDLFDHLRFGTPFAPYRLQLEHDYPAAEQKRFLMIGRPEEFLFDLSQGKIAGGRPVEAPSRKSYELLNILMTDFYKPFPLSGLFSELFPGDHYDLNSSPHRVRQIVYRTRQWIQESGLGLAITEETGRYRMSVEFGTGVLVGIQGGPPSPEALRLDKLRVEFGQRHFSPREARAALDLSATSLKDLMSWALEQGHVVRERGGRASVYRFKAAA